MIRDPFDVNPFQNIQTQEDFMKAMETFVKQLDEACSELENVELELNSMIGAVDQYTD